MNQHYLIGNNNLNDKIKELSIPNFNQSRILSSDDLLSSHPFLTDNNNDLGLNSTISTDIDEKVIIISSSDRDFYNESLFDFKISEALELSLARR